MRRTLAVFALLLSVLFAGTVHAQTNEAATQASPASGHAAVVAQGVEPLPSDSVRWQVANQKIDPANDPAALTGPGFVVADKAALLVTTESGSNQRLAIGEGAFIPAAGASVATLGDSATSFKAIVIGGATSDTTGALLSGASFVAPTGQRDLDLVRDVLKPKENTKVANGETPAVILALKGEVTVKNANGGTIVVSAGKAGELTGPLTVTATSDSTASFVVGMIGPEIESDSTIQPDPTLAAAPTATTAAASEPGMISVLTFRCPDGVTIAAATPDSCGGYANLNSGTISLSGGDLSGSQAPALSDGVMYWSDLIAGQYVISVDQYPDGFSSFAIDTAPGISHSGDQVHVSLASAGNVTINIYFMAPAGSNVGTGTSTLGLTFLECPAGMTQEMLSGQDVAECSYSATPFSVKLSGGSLIGAETVDTLQPGSAQPSLEGAYEWVNLPAGSFTLSIAPSADGDQFYIVRPCGDQSCPKVNVFGDSATIVIEDGEYVTILVYRIPAS